MKKKNKAIGVASVLAAGAGAAVLAKKNSREKELRTPVPNSDYRNTERGKNARNSKGIYYSNGSICETGKTGGR